MILDRILDAKREDVSQRYARTPLERIKEQAGAAGPARDFAGALKIGAFGVIAEL